MAGEIRIYFEGDKSLKPGFSVFFAQLILLARQSKCGFQLIAARSGEEARRDFDLANKTHQGAWNILLRDSEGPQPAHSAERMFWMVESMESWFHADKAALKKFYGPKFRQGALKQNPNVEQIAKRDLVDGLSAATRETDKGDYYRNKTTHGPKLLELINPDLVKKASEECDRIFTGITALLPPSAS
jgi:hypothetical protein